MDEQSPTKVRAYDRSLRIIERSGQILLTGWVGTLVALGIIWPEPYKHAWGLVLSQIMAGRAGSVAWGLEKDFPEWFLLAHCTIQDIIILLLLYPLLVAGYRRTVEWRIVGSTLANIRAAAERHKSKVEPYGAVGLMLFVFFPFWSTGALAGGVIGYLLGMRRRIVFPAVIAGEILAVASWIAVVKMGRDSILDAFGPEALGPKTLLSIFVGVIAIAAVIRAVQLRKRFVDRNNGNGDSENAQKDEAEK